MLLQAILKTQCIFTASVPSFKNGFVLAISIGAQNQPHCVNLEGALYTVIQMMNVLRDKTTANVTMYFLTDLAHGRATVENGSTYFDLTWQMYAYYMIMRLANTGRGKDGGVMSTIVVGL